MSIDLKCGKNVLWNNPESAKGVEPQEYTVIAYDLDEGVAMLARDNGEYDEVQAYIAELSEVPTAQAVA